MMRGYNPEDGEYDQTHLWVMVGLMLLACVGVLVWG